jgi:hypothetical protein
MNNQKLVQFFRPFVTALLILSFFNFSAQAQQYDTLHTLKGFRRYNLLGIYVNNAISNPAQVKKLSDWVKQNGDETEKMNFEFGLELYEMEFRGEPKEKQLTAVEKYIQRVIKLNNPYLLAGLYYFKCDRYKKLKLYNKSIENSLYFVDELKKDPEGEYFEQSWPLYYMGLDFYYYKDYSKALELALAAYKHNNINNPNTSWFVKGCSDLIAMSYLKNGKFDSAKNWLDTTLHYARLHNDTAWIGIATGNMGSIYYLQQQYSKAIPYYEKAIPYCRKYYLWDNVAPFCTNLADCYMQTGKGAAVPALLKEADYANRNNNLPGPNNTASTFKIASAWYRSQGSAVLALQYADSANFYQKKLDDEYSTIAKMQAEANLAYRNKELENIILKQEEKKGRWIRYGLFAALLMVASISILLYKRQNLRHQLKKEKLEHEKLLAEEELHIAMVEIKDFTQNIREKNELIENFAEEINNLKLQNNTITDTQVSFIEDLKQSTILTDGDWARFKQIFEKVHPGFLTRLKTKYPDLTPAETRYLLFTKLGLLPKEMMSVLGVSAEAIRNVRFRIKKKLSPDDNKEIEDFLKEV